ncbi:restriction endonuclease subunit S [Chryseobacterium indologenes]|uniref:restriction endonuclease subunit S n=1 Tax=Chryseobacterium indologenes TaxID=253 RepID=UPI001893EF4F|nr:restriction endonuclease subunit S [Chryseobacterium indologenes]MBF6643580.1 restriction endonuclease subunit S [Chryseobacterium indologenes]
MRVAEKTYLNYINLLRLDNWSVPGLLDATFNYSNQFPLSRIGDFLIKNRNVINIKDEATYKRVTVRINNNGVFLRDTEKGINIGTKKQYLAKSGQFIVSKIDARNGAFGIIPEELNDAIVTNDFPLYDVDAKKINPRFLLLITTTKEFIGFAQSCSSGTTNRQRMDIDMFLNQRIPLPNIEEQEKIVKNYYSKIEEAQNLSKQANDIESEIEEYLFEELGVNKNLGSGTKKGIQTIDFSNIDKWSIDDIFKKNTINSYKYDLRSLNSICTLITDGTHQTPKYFDNGIIFLSAKNVTKEIIDWTDIKYVSKEAHLEYIKRVKPEIDDILLAKNGTTGIAAIVDDDREFSIYVSLALLKPDRKSVFPRYLLHLINSDIARIQFSSRLIGIGVPNLHLGEIREVVIPLPNIDMQINISNNIDNIKTKVKKIQEKVEQLKAQAKKEFEQTIFR